MDAKPVWQSRTVWASAISLIAGLLFSAGVVDVEATSDQIQAWAGTAVAAMGLIFGVLRLITKTPIKRKPRDPGPPPPPYAIAVLLAVLIALPACTVATTAETPSQRAYALIGSYAALADEAAALVETGTVPDAAVVAIAKADTLAYPAVKLTAQTARAYTGVKAELDAIRETGLDPPEALTRAAAGALAELQRALIAAEPAVAALGQAIAGARGEGA